MRPHSDPMDYMVIPGETELKTQMNVQSEKMKDFETVNKKMTPTYKSFNIRSVYFCGFVFCIISKGIQVMGVKVYDDMMSFTTLYIHVS